MCAFDYSVIFIYMDTLNNKTYYELNKEKIKKQRKARDKANKKKLAKQKKDYFEANREKETAYQRVWQKENKPRLRKWATDRKQKDPLYKLKCSTKSLIRNAILEKGFKKLSHTEQILGCTYTEFKAHLESKFEPWMSWDNKGLYNGTLNYGWDIDHIIPLASATCEADIIRLNHYTNLQPLCSYTHRHIKRNK